eukprot:15395672-Alexandrium_andersonii.AAC.1
MPPAPPTPGAPRQTKITRKPRTAHGGEGVTRRTAVPPAPAPLPQSSPSPSPPIADCSPGVPGRPKTRVAQHMWRLLLMHGAVSADLDAARRRAMYARWMP